MPSKSVSFSDEGYIDLVQEQPEEMGFSEWIEKLALKGLEMETNGVGEPITGQEEN